jgi:17beta-estradiol 17-dehydrogenase / very-long-chain 3-oxoacyl-CoA reductase
LQVYVLYDTLKKNNLQKFVGKNSWAVVTGASDGIGAEFCRQLSAAGLNIVLLSRTRKSLEEVAQGLATETKVITIDFSSAFDEDYRNIASELEGLDIAVLVNNVGASHKVAETFLDIEDENLHNMINLNVGATTFMTRVVLTIMVKQKRGLVLNVSTVASLFPLPMHSIYSATKAFVNHLSTALSYEYAEHGIFIECITPAYIKTKLSGIQRVTHDRPEPATFVKSVLSQIGSKQFHTGFSYHEKGVFFNSLIPKFILIPQAMKQLKEARKKFFDRQNKQ